MGNYKFRRSNYFKGKLLTSEDLIRDQNYFMDKQRFIYDMLGLTNRVVRGLHVTKNSENTVSVCAGAAIDAAGKEIFVEKAAIFELKLPEDGILQAHLYVDYSNKNITVDTRSPSPVHATGDLMYAYLCIGYSEHKAGEIPVPVEFSTGGRGFEYIDEGYKLFWDYAGISGEKRDLLYLAKIGFTDNGHNLEIETIQNLPFGQAVSPSAVPDYTRDTDSEMRKDISALTSSVGSLSNLVRRLEDDLYRLRSNPGSGTYV